MTIWDSLLRGASHTLDGEASAQHNSEQDRENEKDSHEGGREVEVYEEKEEDEDERPCGDWQLTPCYNMKGVPLQIWFRMLLIVDVQWDYVYGRSKACTLLRSWYSVVNYLIVQWAYVYGRSNTSTVTITSTRYHI